ncbi:MULTISPECIES: hypothetical protein [Pseudomonas]|uniref:hypothetical protein n=1 Tax=Pseudomonas TaxID=286 RepID=UPI000863683A|nr:MULTISPECIES: hypothetical protein [Pseudomonas]MCL8309043.1 hypothetical protein [Pseudomonas putida]
MAITEFNYFCADAIAVAEKISASVDDEQASKFLESLYYAYEQEGSPKNRKKWIAEKIKDKFICMASPPVWVGEPRWAYLDDVPMVFLNQFKVSNIEGRLADRFKSGDTVFVFGGKTPSVPKEGDAWSVVYKMVVQTEEGEDLYVG